MDTVATRSRRVVVDGTFNLRDLGGYDAADGRTVRWGAAFRADGLHQVRGDAVAGLSALRLRNVVDLRTDDERTEWGFVDGDLVGARYHHRPVIRRTWDRDGLELDESGDPNRFLADRYLDMLDSGAEAIAATVTLLADPAEHATVFHCAAGKDRTGVTAMVVLGLLGVSHDDIVADYALSGGGMERMEAWVRVHRPEMVDRMSRQPRAFRSAPAPAMTMVLADVGQRWGSVTGWAATAGIDGAVVDSLRASLLD